jgi:hypothetical protein
VAIGGAGVGGLAANKNRNNSGFYQFIQRIVVIIILGEQVHVDEFGGQFK